VATVAAMVAANARSASRWATDAACRAWRVMWDGSEYLAIIQPAIGCMMYVVVTGLQLPPGGAATDVPSWDVGWRRVTPARLLWHPTVLLGAEQSSSSMVVAGGDRSSSAAVGDSSSSSSAAELAGVERRTSSW
jgi:hypothetical protein